MINSVIDANNKMQIMAHKHKQPDHQQISAGPYNIFMMNLNKSFGEVLLNVRKRKNIN